MASEKDDESPIKQIEEKIDQQITDEVKESTFDYNLSTRDQVM